MFKLYKYVDTTQYTTRRCLEPPILILLFESTHKHIRQLTLTVEYEIRTSYYTFTVKSHMIYFHNILFNQISGRVVAPLKLTKTGYHKNQVNI